MTSRTGDPEQRRGRRGCRRRDSALRSALQLTTLPPGTQREPMTRSASSSASQQPVQLLGLVGAVGVHLADHVVAALERDREAVEVRRTQPGLLGAVHHADPARRRPRGASARSPVPSGEPSSTTSTSVSGTAVEQPLDDPLEVLGLVVGRDDHDHARARRGSSGLTARPRASPGPVGGRRSARRRRRAAAACGVRRTADGRPGPAGRRATSSHCTAAPHRTPGVTPSSWRHVGLQDRRGARPARAAATAPSGPTTPETPLVATTTTLRPVSTARSRAIANCCSTWPVPM